MDLGNLNAVIANMEKLIITVMLMVIIQLKLKIKAVMVILNQ